MIIPAPVVEQCTGDHFGPCYGELWTCSGCGQTLCQMNGADDDYPDLCDECWLTVNEHLFKKEAT